MASAYYSNTVHIDFASVLAMENPGMVSVFNALMASGLEEFLGCPAVIYESELVDFFKNGSVRDGLVVSTVNGVPVEISEQMFAETFELPVNGLADLSEMPKDKIFDARSIVSLSGEPSPAGEHSQLEIGRIIGVPASKILTDKTVHRYISINDKVGVEEAADAPPMKKASRKTAASKKRPAVAAVEEPVPKKKRTSKKKSGSSPSTLEIMVVAQEAVPIQMVDPSTGVPTAEEPVEQPATEDDTLLINQLTRDQPTDITDERQWFDLSHEELIANWAAERQVITPDDTDEEIEAERPVFESVAAVEPVVEDGEAAADKDFSLSDDPDTVINQVLNQLDSNSDDKDDKSSDRAETWFDRALDEMLQTDSQVVTSNDTDAEMETVVVGVDSGNKPVQTLVEKPVEEMVTVMGDQATTAIGDQQVGSGDELSENIETERVVLSEYEAMSLEDIFMSIPTDIQLPSAGVEITRILFGATIHISGVTERTWYLDSLPKIPVEDKGKELLVEKDPVKGNPVWEQLVLIVAEIELVVQLREKVINEVEQFHSFSRKKLTALQLEDVYTKVEQVLTWAGTDSPIIAPHRKRYILLKYRELLVRKFLEARRINFIPRDGSSAVDLKILDKLHSFHLFVLEELKTETLAHDLEWKLPCCSIIFEGQNRDRGAVITRSNTTTRSSCWIRTMIRVNGTWVIDPVLTSGTVLREVQISQNTVSVAPIVQMLDEPSSSDSSSDDILMDFADQDTTAAANSLPASTTTDVTNALNQLRASIDQIREKDDGGAKNKDTLLLHLSKFENQVIARLDAQDRVLGALRKASNDQRNLLSMELQSSHKKLGAQIVTTGLDVVEVRRVVKETQQELNAKINSLDEQVAATRNDLLEFSAQAQQSLNVITTQLSELVAYINRGGDNKKGESSSSRGPQPPPPPVSTPEFEQRVEMAQRNILERVMDTDRRESLLQAERDRERRRRELSGTKRRRRQ
ncbi:dystroglycan-like [Dorcoceras hygrometricum]|uniref:Dystroglycan-like n=1 Tax=Dorcoceras hygrometricum TaxID=472368 RepID=A0A2Z7D170_9LAMI|nr:dystroglycan-like [Dorcoceras hygrometricum]